MNDGQIVIPEGWTYFAHRTNTERWKENPFSETSINVSKLMSVVDECDIKYEVERNGKSKVGGYTSGKGNPFEIRCLICDLHHIQTLSDDLDIKRIMLKEFYYDKNNFGGCYGQRHHSIPRGEELVIIGFSNYDEIYGCESNIIWTIPRRFIDFYNQEVSKNKNRFISLVSPEHEKVR